MSPVAILFNLMVVAVSVSEITASSEAMKHITSGFMRAMDECKHELNFGDHVIRDLYFYWKEDFTLLNRETGCALVCMSHKLNLLDSSGKMHHGNAKEFALSHGAAEDTAVKVVSSLHECERKNEHHEDHCLWALEVAKCFKIAIDQLNWTPKMETVISEILTDI